MTNAVEGLVERLRAPAYWMSGSRDGHEGENNAPREAADRIEQLEAQLVASREALTYALDDWRALCRIIGENIKENDEEDRVRWKGVWYDGPLATAYLKTLRAVEEMAKRNVAALTIGEE